VEEIPKCAGRMPLQIQPLQLGRSGIEPSHMGPVSNLRTAPLHQWSLPWIDAAPEV
jgi:hypothetical protein